MGGWLPASWFQPCRKQARARYVSCSCLPEAHATYCGSLYGRISSNLAGPGPAPHFFSTQPPRGLAWATLSPPPEEQSPWRLGRGLKAQLTLLCPVGVPWAAALEPGNAKPPTLSRVAMDVGSSVWDSAMPAMRPSEERGWAKFTDFQPFCW